MPRVVKNGCKKKKKAIVSNIKKIRIKPFHEHPQLIKLYQERSKLKAERRMSPQDESLVSLLFQIENEIVLLSSQIKSEKIRKHVDLLTSDIDSLERVNMWQLKRDVCQDKYTERPSAKYDTEGNLVTGQKQLLKLYENTY